MACSKQPVQGSKLGISAAACRAGQHAGRNSLPQVVFLLALGAAHHNHAVCVRQKDLAAGRTRRNENLALNGLHGLLIPRGGAAPCLLQDANGVVYSGQQVFIVFRAEIAHGQVHLNKPHQRHAAHQQERRGIEIARGNAFSHRPAPPSPACRDAGFAFSLSPQIYSPRPKRSSGPMRPKRPPAFHAGASHVHRWCENRRNIQTPTPRPAAGRA